MDWLVKIQKRAGYGWILWPSNSEYPKTLTSIRYPPVLVACWKIHHWVRWFSQQSSMVSSGTSHVWWHQRVHSLHPLTWLIWNNSLTLKHLISVGPFGDDSPSNHSSSDVTDREVYSLFIHSRASRREVSSSAPLPPSSAQRTPGWTKIGSIEMWI